MKKLTLFSVLYFGAFMLLQVQAQTEFAKKFAPLLSRSFDLTLEVAEAMPENLYLYSPDKKVKNFAQQLIHCTHAADAIIDIYVMENTNRKFKEPDASRMSKAEVIETIKAYKAAVLEKLNALSEEDLSKRINLFGSVDTDKQECFYFIRDHITNHRAKANLYMRLCGLTPPAYGYY